MTLEQKQAPVQATQAQSPGAAASPAHRASWRSRVGRIAGRVIPVALTLGILLLVWQRYASRPDADQQILPTPVAVWNALVAQREVLWGHSRVTLYETAVGFAAALIAGVVFAKRPCLYKSCRKKISRRLTPGQGSNELVMSQNILFTTRSAAPLALSQMVAPIHAPRTTSSHPAPLLTP